MEGKLNFVLSSDWHIGYVQYGSIERWKDFIRAAQDWKNSVIDLKNEKPIDFIFHGGDLFHSSQPVAGDILNVYLLLLELKKLWKIPDNQKPPFYVIRGNHDASSSPTKIRGGSSLELLDELKVIHLVQDEVIEVKPGVFLYGLGYYGKLTNKKLEELVTKYPVKPNVCNILLIHAGIEEKSNDLVYADIKEADITKHRFDIICLGHYHQTFFDEIKRIFNPGSLDHTSMNEWDKEIDDFHSKKSYYYISMEKNSSHWKITAKTQYINVRPKRKIVYTIKSKTEPKLIEELQELLDKTVKKGAIIHYEFIGETPKGTSFTDIFKELEKEISKKVLKLEFNYQDTSYSYSESTLVSPEKVIENFLIKNYSIKKEFIGSWLQTLLKTTKLLASKPQMDEESPNVLETIREIESLIESAPMNKAFTEQEED